MNPVEQRKPSVYVGDFSDLLVSQEKDGSVNISFEQVIWICLSFAKINRYGPVATMYTKVAIRNDIKFNVL